MFDFYARKLLSEEDLHRVNDLLKSGTWSRDTIEYYAPAQTNVELVDSPERQEINALVMSRIDKDELFIDFTFPTHTSYPLISKSESGNGFRIHLDQVQSGDFSTTVFLSDPETYVGGELKIWLNGVEKNFKLPAGYAVTYLNRYPHCVNPVTEGERNACVFWTKSSVKDEKQREILTGLRRVRRLLPEVHSYDFNEAVNDPEFIVRDVENKLVRYFFKP